jgi:hypothetical protein
MFILSIKNKQVKNKRRPCSHIHKCDRSEARNYVTLATPKRLQVSGVTHGTLKRDGTPFVELRNITKHFCNCRNSRVARMCYDRTREVIQTLNHHISIYNKICLQRNPKGYEYVPFHTPLFFLDKTTLHSIDPLMHL